MHDFQKKYFKTKKKKHKSSTEDNLVSGVVFRLCQITNNLVSNTIRCLEIHKSNEQSSMWPAHSARRGRA